MESRSREVESSDGPGTILIVDDETRNRSLARHILETHLHVRVVEAADGAAAIGAVERQRPDLVLLDVMMPGMDGYEVCRRLKGASGDRWLPIVMITALGEQSDRNRGLEAGADDFLSKPVDTTELRLRVRHLLEMKRQRELIERQFEELRRLDALKDDLFSLIVHDLRNPLTGVLGFLHMFETGLPDPALRKDAAMARQAAEKLKDTLEDMLQLRLMERGEIEPRRRRVRLGAVAAAACASVEGAARLRNVSLRATVDEALEAELDESMVRRAIENLLTNAVKYSPAGQPVDLTASLDGERVTFTVADRGAGVSDDTRARLFEKFGGVGSKRYSDRRSFGLGLYFVRLCAEAHGGGVHVAQRPGGGTVFSFTTAAAGTAGAGAPGAPRS
jgi:two-component system sensor histidine kinase/response regulator